MHDADIAAGKHKISSRNCGQPPVSEHPARDRAIPLPPLAGILKQRSCSTAHS
jgi:hypothetical protein